MKQELQYEEFVLKIQTQQTTNNSFHTNTFLNLDLYLRDQHATSVSISTPIKNLESLQSTFDFVMVTLGIEFCKLDELSHYYEFFAPHVKEILSNYCIRENSDEDIQDVNLLYIRSKFLETT